MGKNCLWPEEGFSPFEIEFLHGTVRLMCGKSNVYEHFAVGLWPDSESCLWSADDVRLFAHDPYTSGSVDSSHEVKLTCNANKNFETVTGSSVRMEEIEEIKWTNDSTHLEALRRLSHQFLSHPLDSWSILNGCIPPRSADDNRQLDHQENRTWRHLRSPVHARSDTQVNR